ncbi:MAG: hypothetical protein K0R09_3319 [Clostridiales bacterium]|jgi:hypothetical protein|nr:hypothetical protein [Clostridiales bacterium]
MTHFWLKPVLTKFLTNDYSRNPNIVSIDKKETIHVQCGKGGGDYFAWML